MVRAGRLLKLMQILRRHQTPVTAERLAREVEVSERTIYRDIATLMADGAPIRGQAGVGYVLGAGYFLPPLTFSPDEIEALLVGLSMLEARADVALATAAHDALAKIGAVIPNGAAPLTMQRTVTTPQFGARAEPECVDVAEIRTAIRDNRKIDLSYVDENGDRTERTIWPLVLAYFEMSRVLVAWCEKRAAFRHFRTDRILSMRVEKARYPGSRAKLRRAYLAENPHVGVCLPGFAAQTQK